MLMLKARILDWILGFLLGFYLAGILLRSTITVDEPQVSGNNSKALADQKNQISRIRDLQYELLLRKLQLKWCSDLQYHNPPKDIIIALASFPGSGNTWLRYLLQQATGIYTGSVYKDRSLLKNGFPAESISNGSVLVVKVHEWGPEARKPFSKAILLVRSAAPAIQAEFNRQISGHIGLAPPDWYKNTRGKYWQQFVSFKLEAWKQMNLDWLYNFTGPTHVVFYEQLVDSVQHTLTILLKFLEVPISDHLLSCALERQEGIYRRKRRLLNFDPYTMAMKKRLQVEQQKVYEAIYSIALSAKKRR